MTKELIVNATPTGVEIALLENNILVELHREQVGNNFLVGDIFIGSVKKIVPGLNAAFVDIGYSKDAFLHYTDLGPQIRSLKKCLEQARKGARINGKIIVTDIEPEIDKAGKIEEVLKRRDLLLVQILKEPIATKGPRLSCEVTFPSRYVVLIPFNNTVSISRKIKHPEERKRLERVIDSLRPPNFGAIIRTAAEGKKVEELQQDIERQFVKWTNIISSLPQVKPPEKVLSEMSKASSILRDILDESFSHILANDKNVVNDLKNFVGDNIPSLTKVVQYHQGRYSIFERHNISKQIKASFGKVVNLSTGAYLVIEHTEAMHVIDVNSGYKVSTRQDQETQALTINLEAAAEIARQLRLRDLGGIIAIDFIDLKDPDNRKMVHRRMKDCMSVDRARHTILPLSRFCIMEVTRQRVRPDVKIATAEICPVCKGSGKVKATILLVDEIESNLSYLLKEMDYHNLKLVVHPYIAAYLKQGFISIQWKWFWKYKKWVKIDADTNYYLTQYHFYDARNEEIKL